MEIWIYDDPCQSCYTPIREFKLPQAIILSAMPRRRETQKYQPLVVNGTSFILAHFRSKHKLDKYGNKILSLPQSSTVTGSPGPNSPLISLSVFDKFRMLLIKWLVFCHIAFSQVENTYFLALISFLSETFTKLMPNRKTIRGWVSAEFQKRKMGLSKELRRARSKIHLSFDLWTSPNCHGMTSAKV